ncbi:MAG: hypothetical protein HPY61_07210 [Methanotrichaceae archaeon]|nr:hypothetical protein [Methanotrichaceae archaeon]
MSKVVPPIRFLPPVLLLKRARSNQPIDVTVSIRGKSENYIFSAIDV